MDLTSCWSESGLQVGDTILIHSSLARLALRLKRAGLDPDASKILESFRAAVGSSGTLLFPLFNFDFTKGVPFDIRSTPSQMGSLTEAARLHPEAVRTGHPIYSFAVLGAKKDLFANIDNLSGYAEDSPFGVLHRLEGKIAVLDLPDQNSMTFYHHVEEVKQVPYRYFKNFTGSYTDSAGKTTNRTYKLFVRNIEKGVLTHVNPAGDLMWEKKLYTGNRPGEGSGLRVVSASKMFNFVSGIIDAGKANNLLYRIEKGIK